MAKANWVSQRKNLQKAAKTRLSLDSNQAWSFPRRWMACDAVRPWQHVLNPLSGYLTLAQRLWHEAALAGGWNFGPEPEES